MEAFIQNPSLMSIRLTILFLFIYLFFLNPSLGDLNVTFPRKGGPFLPGGSWLKREFQQFYFDVWKINFFLSDIFILVVS